MDASTLRTRLRSVDPVVTDIALAITLAIFVCLQIWLVAHVRPGGMEIPPNARLEMHPLRQQAPFFLTYLIAASAFLPLAFRRTVPWLAFGLSGLATIIYSLAQIQDMTDAERQQFFQEKMGSADPRGAAGGPGGMGGRMGGALEGEVIEVAEDTITIKTANGSSQTVYTDDDTVIGYAQGAAQIAAGSSVMVMASPEADGVMTATGILVK